jgi:hypothetical protein
MYKLVPCIIPLSLLKTFFHRAVTSKVFIVDSVKRMPQFNMVLFFTIPTIFNVVALEDTFIN